jgi:hypothetical protein
MKQLFVRFGLPWMIFSSAIYALYWNVLYGETSTSIVKVAPRTFDAPPSGHPYAIKTNIEKPIGVSTNIEVSNAPVTTNVVAPVASPPPPITTVGSPTSESNILLALKDADPNTRYRALAESDTQGIALPAHVVQQLATSDRDPLVRILAMNKFSQYPEVEPALVKSVAEAALRDTDSTISAHAREMLEQLNQASRANEENAQLVPDDAPVE